MSLLKQEPAGSVKSLEELFAIAAAMEQEAATRYAEIAARMRQEGDPALAEVFERLSADEQGHLDSVVHWSEKTKGQAPDPARIRWELPETFDDEGAATAHPRLLSAYRALSMAVRNEERAFAFWSYVAAHAEVPEIRQAAEAMAHEELGHVATLRRERRSAFHAERRQAHAGAGADGWRRGPCGAGAAACRPARTPRGQGLAAGTRPPPGVRRGGAAPRGRTRAVSHRHGARRVREGSIRPIRWPWPSC